MRVSMMLSCCARTHADRHGHTHAYTDKHVMTRQSFLSAAFRISIFVPFIDDVCLRCVHKLSTKLEPSVCVCVRILCTHLSVCMSLSIFMYVCMYMYALIKFVLFFRTFRRVCIFVSEPIKIASFSVTSSVRSVFDPAGPSQNENLLLTL